MYQRIECPWHDDFDYGAFRQQIEDFSYVLFTPHLRSLEAFKAELVSHLARLYASGTQMPPYSPFAGEELSVEREAPSSTPAEEAEARRHRLERLAGALKLSLGDDDAYFAVEWPDEREVVERSLSRELASTHDELMGGASQWDAGRRDDAASTWATGFEEGCWGASALSALGALHYCAGERMSLLLGPLDRTSRDIEYPNNARRRLGGP